MTPDPAVIGETLARTKLLRTPVTVCAQPAVAAEVSMVEHCVSAPSLAFCSARITSLGAVPQIVCERAVQPFSGNPPVVWKREPPPGLSHSGSFVIEREHDLSGRDKIRQCLRIVISTCFLRENSRSESRMRSSDTDALRLGKHRGEKDK